MNETDILEGKLKFTNAHRKAFFSDVLSALMGKPTTLLSFDDIKHRLHLHNEHYKGLQDIQLHRIVGSVGRYHEFTARFLPKNGQMSERWSRVYAQMHTLQGVPPIEVYQIDDVYFVRDGNHRVAIARELGDTSIEAYVTVLPTPIDLEPNMRRQDWDTAEAYAYFLEQTGLDDTRPAQERIWLTAPLRYAELVEHIRVVAHMLCQECGEDVSLQDAATHWYDHIYAPVIELVRKYDMVDATGARTEADLYVWLVAHFGQLREMTQGKTSDYSLSELLTTFLGWHHLPVPVGLAYEKDAPPSNTLQKVAESNSNNEAQA